MEAIKINPNDPNIRNQALAAGRIYSNLTRKNNGVTLFDEVAIMNDINAAYAGRITSQNEKTENPTSNTQDRLKHLQELRISELITEEEYGRQREKIINAL